MTAQLIDGKAIAGSIRNRVKVDVEHRTQRGLRRPGLAVILIGHDPASEVYVSHKHRACENAGRCTGGGLRSGEGVYVSRAATKAPGD